MARLLRHLQRRALVVLTWLVLALSVAPAAKARGGRAHAVLVAAVLGSGGAATVRTAPVAGSAAVASTGVASAEGARPQRVVGESAVVAREPPRAGGIARAASAFVPHRAPPRDGRRLYLTSSRFLC